MNDIMSSRPRPWISAITLFAVNCIYQPAAVAMIFFAGISRECLSRDCGYGLVIAPVLGTEALAVALGAGWSAFVVCRDWPGPKARLMKRVNLASMFLLPFILFGLAMCWIHAHPAPIESSHGPLWG